MENKVSYAIAMNIYRALGGELSGFDSVEEVYAAIDAIYAESGGRVTIEPLSTTVTGAGTYRYDSEDVTGYKPVEVTVDVKEGFNFGVIGYTPEESELVNAPMAADLAYSKSLLDAWDPNNTSAMNLYNGDTKLVYAPLIDTSNVTNMNQMFAGCSSLMYVPLFDTSKVTVMTNMFGGCSSLTTVPLFDTSKVTSMSNTFSGCTTLVSLPLLDFSKVTSVIYIFGFTDLTKLTDIEGFKNLGAQPSLSINSSYGFNKVPNMTYKSVMNIINNLYDRASAGYSVVTLKLATKTLALLSEDDIAIATNKGWTIS